MPVVVERIRRVAVGPTANHVGASLDRPSEELVHPIDPEEPLLRESEDLQVDPVQVLLSDLGRGLDA